MDTVTLITDGSADNRVGSGGWSAIIRSPSTLIELVGSTDTTTSNRMELTAVIEGLRAIKVPSRVELVSDSAYVLNAIRNKWFDGWLIEADKRITKLLAENQQVRNPRPNLDLWRQLKGLCEFHQVVPIKVKGHSGDYWNTRADRLADQARREKLSYVNTLLEFSDVRCDSTSPSTFIQCKLHQGHSGNHLWTNGKRNGVDPYGTVVQTI